MNKPNFDASAAACWKCQAACSACCNACIQNPRLKELLRCIALNRDCALFCNTALLLLEHGSEFLAQTCALLADICDASARESAQFDLPECKQVVMACARCAAECRLTLRQLARGAKPLSRSGNRNADLPRPQALAGWSEKQNK